MSNVNTGNVPGSSGGIQPPGTPVKPQGTVDGADSDAFENAVAKGDGEAVKEKTLTGEEELRKLISEQAVKQFTERSKEMTDEIKKNLEG